MRRAKLTTLWERPGNQNFEPAVANRNPPPRKFASAKEMVAFYRAKSNAEREATRAFIASHGEVPFEIAVPTAKRKLLVSRDPRSRLWRVTTFDDRGPSGHWDSDSYEKLLNQMQAENAIDLSTARFSAFTSEKPSLSAGGEEDTKKNWSRKE